MRGGARARLRVALTRLSHAQYGQTPLDECRSAEDRGACKAAIARGRRKFELCAALPGTLPQSASALRSHLSASELYDPRVWLVVALFV